MDAEKYACPYPSMYRRVIQTNRQQLRAGHVPVLPRRNAGDFFRQTKVISHTAKSIGDA